jgi:hypothetical protein
LELSFAEATQGDQVPLTALYTPLKKAFYIPLKMVVGKGLLT